VIQVDGEENADVYDGDPSAGSSRPSRAHRPPAARVDELGGDAVVFRVDYWIRNLRRRDIVRVRSAFARAVKSRLEASGHTISPAS
jgi:hypothetical protein